AGGRRRAGGGGRGGGARPGRGRGASRVGGWPHGGVHRRTTERVMDAVTSTPVPVNEPIRSYAPGSPERASLEARLKDLGAAQVELTMTVGGVRRMAGGEPFAGVQPHRDAAGPGTGAPAPTQGGAGRVPGPHGAA